MSNVIIEKGVQRPLTPYEPNVNERLFLVIGIAIIILGELAHAGYLSGITWPREISWQLLTGVGVPLVLIVGAAIVIYRVRKAALPEEKFSGAEHWKKVRILDCTGHLDLSSVDSEGNGIARFYLKPTFEASLTGAGLALITPLYVACVIAYNLLRCVLIPFYILYRMYQERNGQPIYSSRKFQWSDIPKEMGLSLYRVLRAPFYGTALFYTGLKAVIDPLNAIKEGAMIEHHWNDGVPLQNQGIWMMACLANKDWKWEGGGGPLYLGQNAFYAAGSWQPYEDVLLIKWEMKAWHPYRYSHPKLSELGSQIRNFPYNSQYLVLPEGVRQSVAID